MNLADTLADLLTRENRLSFGEIVLTRSPEGSYSATHREDEGKATGLEPLNSVRELREMAKNDARTPAFLKSNSKPSRNTSLLPSTRTSEDRWLKRLYGALGRCSWRFLRG